MSARYLRSIFGSSASRKPSPSRLNASTVKKIASAGKMRHVRRGQHVGARGVEHRAPFGRRRLRAHAEERQARRGDDRRADAQREVHDDRRDRARERCAGTMIVQSDAPRLRAASMYVRCLSASVLPRTRRANVGMLNTATATIDVRHAAAEDRDDADREQDAGECEQHVADAHDRCGPTSLRSSRRAGPSIVPMTAPIATETKPAASEMRAPIRMRLKMSRPSASTPNQCCHDGRALSLS